MEYLIWDFLSFCSCCDFYVELDEKMDFEQSSVIVDFCFER